MTMKPTDQALAIHSPKGSYKATFLPARGGLLSSLVAHGQELFYQHDFIHAPRWPDLPGGCPFLFPVCARLSYQNQLGAYTYNNQVYRMPIHGVGWWQAWTVTDHGKHHLVLALSDTPASQAMFPFSFTVTLHYQLSENGLTCTQHYDNLSPEPMPYYAGFHPYWHVPLDEKSTTMLMYKPIKRLLYNNDLTDIIGEQPLFKLPCPVDNPELNEQLTQIEGGQPLCLQYHDGRRITFFVTSDTDSDMFRYVQLYTQNDRPFFCIEPWMAPPNSLNHNDARWLAPHSQEQAQLHLSVAP